MQYINAYYATEFIATYIILVKYLKLYNIIICVEGRGGLLDAAAAFSQMTFDGKKTENTEEKKIKIKRFGLHPLSRVKNLTGTRIRKLKRNNAAEGIQ